MTGDPDSNGPNDTEIGLTDAVMTLIDVFLQLGVPQSVLAKRLQFQRDAQRLAGRAAAAAVLDTLLDFVNDEERARVRQAFRLFSQEPPEGTA
ncbi:MAG: hypothetical protein ACLQME_10680 [Alphaproteobacteria bacterium]